MLKVNDINVYYGAIHAIKGISFEVNDGEVVTLIGANGAGKSTTLNTVCGLLRSRTGSIEFLDRNLASIPPHKVVELGMAHVPEGRRIFQQMTVEENLEMGAYTQARSTIAPNLERVYEQFPRLKERRRQVAGTLSGGEQQMLAMGRGLMDWLPFWWSRFLRLSSSSTRRAPPSCWWSRTPGWPCPWPTGAMCWRRARSWPPAPAASSSAMKPSKKPTSAASSFFL